MKIDRLTIDSFEKQESCPWCRSRRYLAVAHLQFNTAYHTPQEKLLIDNLIIKHRKVVRCLDCGLYYHLLIPSPKTLSRMIHREEKKQITQTKDPIWTFRCNRNAYEHAHLLQVLIPHSSVSVLEAKMTGSLWWYFNLFEHFVFLYPASTMHILSHSGFEINRLDEVFHVNPRALKKKRPIKNYVVTALAWIATLGGAYAQFYRCLLKTLHKSGRLPKLYGRNHLFILAQKRCG